MENNNNNKEFITREIFDANILAIREAIAASEARCERMTAEMRNEYKLVQQRLDNIEKSQDSFIRNMSLALTGMTLLFTFLQIFLR